MKAFTCLLAAALAVAVTLPGCDAFPSGKPDGHGHDDIHDHKNWGGHDIDVNVVPVSVSSPIPQFQNWGSFDLDGLTGGPLSLSGPISQYQNWGGYDLGVTGFPGSYQNWGGYGLGVRGFPGSYQNWGGYDLGWKGFPGSYQNWGGYDLGWRGFPGSLPGPIQKYQNWGGYDLGVKGFPGSLPGPIQKYQNWGYYDGDSIHNPHYGKQDGNDGKNVLDKVLEDVGYTVSVPGNYGKGGVVSGMSIGNVQSKSILIQGTS